MIGLQITAKDVKAAKLVKPGWYATKITDLKNEVGKDKESENFIAEVEGMEGDAQGVPAAGVFPEKYPQLAIAYVNATGRAMGINKAADEEKGLDPLYRFEAAKGLVVYAQWGTWRGKDGSEKPRNNITDWAPLPTEHPMNSMNVSSNVSEAPASFA